jgi:hypothetical protein
MMNLLKFLNFSTYDSVGSTVSINEMIRADLLLHSFLQKERQNLEEPRLSGRFAVSAREESLGGDENVSIQIQFQFQLFKTVIRFNSLFSESMIVIIVRGQLKWIKSSYHTQF